MARDESQNSSPTEKPWLFQKGQSGNPGGRPKKKPISELYDQILNDPELIEEFRDSVIKSIKKGSMVSMFQLKEMADRVEGKVPSKVTVDGEVVLTISERLKRAKERKKKR